MESDVKPVKKCVCHDTTFRDLNESGLTTVEEIADRFGCTMGCGLCRAYIERMLLTGEIEFDVEIDG